MDIQNAKRDSATIAAGEWVGDIPGMADLRLRVRGLSSPKAVATRSRKERAAPKSDRNRDGSLKPEAAQRIFGEVLAEAVLLDWEGLTNGGKAVKFDADKAKGWLVDPDFAPFADAVAWAAMAVDRGQAETTEEIAGN